MQKDCPLCTLPLRDEPFRAGDQQRFDCLNCGPYAASGTALAMIASRGVRAKAIISHQLTLRREAEPLPLVTSHDVNYADEHAELPRAREAKLLLLRWLARISDSIGETLDIHYDRARASAGVETPDAVAVLLQGLERDGLIASHEYSTGALVQITTSGWEQLEGERRFPQARFRETGWARVDRTVSEIRNRLGAAETEEQCQSIGHLCREALISLAQAVVAEASRPEGVSDTDANGLLAYFLETEMRGSSHEASRRYIRSVVAVANELQHRRTATRRDAHLCAEATAAAINFVAILKLGPDRE